MKIQQLLQHHGIQSNPFAEEDAQTDPVFKEHCIASTYHPTWDKIYGNPTEPATSIVFGEKGSGKTAIRLQIVQHLARYNSKHPGERVYVIEYDDFNPFLDRFADKVGLTKRGSTRALSEWKLWDHMDAILSLGVTSLVDQILNVRQPTGSSGNDINGGTSTLLDRHQKRDLLLLAACYDQSTAETSKSRWHRLRKVLKYPTWKSLWDKALGIMVPVVVLAIIIYFGKWSWLKTVWPYLLAVAAWLPWFVRASRWLMRSWAISRNVRVGNYQIQALRQILMNFSAPAVNGQPLPSKRRTDDRYELFMKFQGLLRTLGFKGIIILVDRLDEPHLINGQTERMRDLLWPMLDNKFLKQPGVGFKLLLPIELTTYIDRESREFYERSRLDKQNMIPSLEWTAQSLFDVANARIKACAEAGTSPTLRDLFDSSITDQRIMEAMRLLRVPRHLFKFLYRLLVAHANAHTDDDPCWEISSDVFESTLALYTREQDAADRGIRTS